MAQQTVLIIEDDEVTSALLEMIVSEAGFQALIALDGVSALELYQRHLPEVVLLDINLPQLNGYSFASLVRNFSDHKPRIIVVTSNPADYEQHLKELADGCLVKPIKRQALLSLLA
ncbi:response regulator [Trichlorobacter lovleyi]|jgi:Response regulators consisting of a CheY-like receiver domain and a winged-helix DNA-binding domain|uniref:Response regulator receiver protein n=1 Tax=Trichlorobacter lovleyi (strain ATCC BAA-1151 / DSM 17278 / SZ) TaxID=398767 RepID=B3E283_TRIL1|nr:response regulator [Trichlorobacter lovleyi]ACD97186.1 response regulator receiver protein [Trichlorobacter lovleyi SZ]